MEWFTGRGNGKFGLQSDRLSYTPLLATTADLDRDGNLDLIVASTTPNKLTLYRGLGTGLFGVMPSPAPGAPAGVTTSFISLVNRPIAMVNGDFNQDQIPDIVVLFSNKISIFLGQANGTLSLATTLNISGTHLFSSMTGGDFNGDGYPDLAVTDPISSDPTVNGNVLVFLNQSALSSGASVFTTPASATYPVLTQPGAIVAADLNGDSVMELIVGNLTYDASSGQSNTTLSVLEGNPNGTFKTATHTITTDTLNPQALVAGNFKGNGATVGRPGGTVSVALLEQDLNTSECSVRVFLGDSTIPLSAAAGRTRSSSITGQGCSSMVLGSFRGLGSTGNLDLLVNGNDGASNATYTLLNGSAGGSFSTSTSPPRSTLGADFLTVGDFNNDGSTDLVILDQPNRKYEIILGQHR
jgi:hypothetical protein